VGQPRQAEAGQANTQGRNDLPSVHDRLHLFEISDSNKYTTLMPLSQPRVFISREIKDTDNLEPLYFL
jgi:hypothetical protein